MAPVQSNASVVATGLGIRYIGEHAYGYSGQVNAGGDATDASFLDFTTGSGYIVGKFQFTYAPDTYQEADCRYRIKLNGEIVLQYWDTSEVRAGGDPNQFLPILIPPFTRVETFGAMAASAGAQLQCCTFSGRVYGAE